MKVDQLFDDSPTFETERLLLRKMNLEDAEDYYAFASDPLTTVHTIWDQHKSIEDSLNYLKGVMHRYDKQESFHWGIVWKTTNKLIGRTGLIHCDAFHQKAEIGFGLSRLYWNQGIITEATQTIIQYGFNHLDIHRIEGRCNWNNLGSAKVMEKLGMTFEGILREQLKIKGKFLDQRMYAILAWDVVTNR